MVSDVLQSGISGIQRAQRDARTAAENIAQQIAPSYAPPPSTDSDTATNNVVSEDRSTSIDASLVDLKVSENQAKAATGVIRTADEVLGTLINTVA